MPRIEKAARYALTSVPLEARRERAAPRKTVREPCAEGCAPRSSVEGGTQGRCFTIQWAPSLRPSTFHRGRWNNAMRLIKRSARKNRYLSGVQVLNGFKNVQH